MTLRGRPFEPTPFDAALLAKVEHEAELIEQKLYGPDGPLLADRERKNLREALAVRHQRMADILNRYAA